MSDDAPSQKVARRISGDLLALLCLLSLAVIFFRDAIFSRASMVLGNPIIVDMTNQWYPWRLFGFGALRRGVIPLWNPYCFCGSPFLANWYSGLFYPPNWTFLVLPVHVALNHSFVLHVALCGIFTYAYMRTVIGDRLSALFAAVTFMFSAQLILRIFAGHLSLVCAMAWFPLELLMLEQGLRKGRIAYYALCGAAFAAQITAGYPQLVLYSGIMAALYFLCRLFSLIGAGGGFRGAAAALGGAVALCAVAVGLSAVQIMPSLEFTAHSSRRAMTYSEAAGSSFPPENVATFLVPELLGDFVNAACTGRAFLWEASAYMGILPLALALLALLYRRNYYTALFAIVGAASFIVALGGYTPALKFLFVHFPGFSVIRGNSKAFFITAYCLSFLAGIGCRLLKDELSPENKILRGRCILLMVVLLLLAAVLAAAATAPSVRALCGKMFLHVRGAFLIEGEKPPAPGDASSPCPDFSLCAKGAHRAVLFLVLTVVVIGIRVRRYVNGTLMGMLIGAIAVIDLWGFAGRYVETSQEAYCWWPRAVVHFLSGDRSFYRTWRDIRVHIPGVNQNMNDGICSLDGYEANTVESFGEFVNSFDIRSEGAAESMLSPDKNRFISLANVKYLIVPSSVRRSLPAYVPRFGGRYMKIYENTRVMPRAFVVHRAVVAKDRRDAVEIMKGDGFDPRAVVVLDERPAIPPSGAAATSEAKIVSYEPGEVRVLCGLREPGILFLGDVYYPGWDVTIDGKPGRIIRANYTFRAVALDKGAHLVRFRYRPFSFRCGAFLSLVTVAACMLWWPARRIWTRKGRGNRNGGGFGVEHE